MRNVYYILYTYTVCKIALSKEITHLFPPQGNLDVVTQILPKFPKALNGVVRHWPHTTPESCTHLPSHTAIALVYRAGRQLNPSYCHLDAYFTGLPSHTVFFLNKHAERLSSKPSTPTPPFPRMQLKVWTFWKKINDFFIDCTGQHCVTAFLAYVWWIFVFLGIFEASLLCQWGCCCVMFHKVTKYLKHCAELQTFLYCRTLTWFHPHGCGDDKVMRWQCFRVKFPKVI